MLQTTYTELSSMLLIFGSTVQYCSSTMPFRDLGIRQFCRASRRAFVSLILSCLVIETVVAGPSSDRPCNAIYMVRSSCYSALRTEEEPVIKCKTNVLILGFACRGRPAQANLKVTSIPTEGRGIFQYIVISRS